MNVQLKDITVTARDGRVSHLDQVYIRGSHVRFFIVPDMLRYVDYRVISCASTGDSTRDLLQGNGLLTIALTGMLPCSAHEASVGVVSVWRVVRLLCSGRAASGGLKRDVCVKGTRVQCKTGQSIWLAFVFRSVWFHHGKVSRILSLAVLGLSAFVREDSCIFRLTNEYPRQALAAQLCMRWTSSKSIVRLKRT